MKSFKSQKGFTLAELLISLAILGVIATFTIPKILSSSQNGQNTAIAKEVASMISAAYSNYTLTNGAATTVGPKDLIQYFNYVSTTTSGDIADGTSGLNMPACSAALVCLKLHNGAVMMYDTAQTFGGSTTTHAIPFNVDPDGTGTQGAITFWQYYNGRFTTGGNATTPTVSGGTITTTTADPAYLANWN